MFFLRRNNKYKRFIRMLSTLLVLMLLLPAAGTAKDVELPPIISTKELFVLKGSPKKPFRQPTDLALGREGRIYVMDGLNSRVAVFSSQGTYQSSFGAEGSKSGQFYMPVGIGISPAGEVFVADSGNHRIQVFSADGKFLRKFSLKKGAKADPTDVLVPGLKDFCYVVDNDNHEIQVYNQKSGDFINSWGGHGKNVGEFRYPGTISIDSSNNLYIVDVMNARVQTFDPFGGQSREISGWGVKVGKVFRPKGVTVDKEGRIFISDSYIGNIQIFRIRGDLIGILGDSEGKAREFKTPTNILIDSKHRLYVVETLANQITVLQTLK